jgi:hypothetical protein
MNFAVQTVKKLNLIRAQHLFEKEIVYEVVKRRGYAYV